MSLCYQLNYGGKKPSSWRFFVRVYKKETRRRARRLAKILMEDAPKRNTKGWAD